jgi:hypothetical protein
MIVPKARRCALLIALLSLLATGAQEKPKKVDVSIQFLTELNIVELTIEVDPFSDWVKPVIAAVESQFKDESASRTVIVQVTLHRNRPADVTVAGNPALSPGEIAALQKSADPAKAPRTKVVDCTFRVQALINGGHPDKNGALVPAIKTPDDHRLAEFRAASTAEKVAILRRWARTEALPILAAAAAHAEAKFEGVRRLGQSIGKLEPDKPIDFAAVTDRNPDCWRALLEMTPGQPFVAAVRVALHVANGEIDRARRYAEVATFFDDRKNLFSRVLGEFGMMKDNFYKDVDSRINQGIALHDKDQLAEALKVYGAVLKDYPNSAWAHYEQFHTLRAVAVARGGPDAIARADWPKVRAVILDCDPLYPMMAEARGAEEMYELTRRIKINELFKDRAKDVTDIVQYADIALDLKDYGFAAMIYWNSLTLGKPDDANVVERIDYFLYCLEQLGVKNLKENFNGDHAAAFARIKAQRRELMEKNAAFRAGEKTPDDEPARGPAKKQGPP